ncbi:MAG: PepSY domain-containing protein [Pyrinomonadaceae bacterium]
MKLIGSTTAVLFLTLAFSIGLFGAAQTVKAQNTDKQKTEKKHDRDDDEKKEEAEEAKERKNQDKLMREASVTLEQARAAALERVQGKVLEEEIEKENGKLVWSFDIRDENGKAFDVKVDAKTGTVVAAEEDDDEDDAGAQSRGNKNIFEKMGSGIKDTTAKIYRKITGN